MANDRNTDPNEGTPRDPRRDALQSEWLNHHRSYEQTEAEHHEKLNRERASYDSLLNRKHKQADMVEKIELDRLQSMRTLRSELDAEIIAAHDIASRCFASLGMEYRPGKSKVDDLYKTEPLPASIAAERIGVPLASTHHDGLLKVLKFAGMIGCILLGTVGMGALILHIQPKSLLHSPLSIIAFGLALILVGGVYLVIAPTSRRVGSQIASKPNEPSTKKACNLLVVLVAVFTVIVALVDAKAIMAINATRAMINPESAPSFILAFLIAAALSATYVLGTAVLGLYEGFNFESKKRIEAEQDRHTDSFRQRQKNSLEVAQACEALNSVDVIEARRKDLDSEIRSVEQGLRQSLNDTYADTGAPPELSEDQKKQLRLHEQEARFAAQKLNAYDSLRSKFSRSSEHGADGDRA